MKQISDILRKKREEKKLTLETVNMRTRLSVRYLRALEEGDLSAFPAEVYFIGTLRTYAQFLGLNGDELVQRYRQFIDEGRKAEAAPVADRKRSGNRQQTYLVLLSAIILLIAGLVVAAVRRAPQRDAAREPAPSLLPAEPQSSTPTVTSVPVPPAKPEAAKKVLPTADPAASPHAARDLTLEIAVSTTSWVKIMADDATVFEGTLFTGARKKWNARERFYLSIGYVPGVTAKLNGKKVDVARGASKDLNQLTLTRESVGQ